MGTVYLAHDTHLGRPVALKVLLGSLARNPDQVARFLNEARAAAPLQHPGIVGIYEAGVRSGIPFIAMEYVEGETLERFLRRSGPLDWRHALYLGTQVADALACAHHQGIVHRDVKPANILLDRSGRVRLADFGIAGVQQRGLSPDHRYSLFGTPEYMSPEQCGSREGIDARSDLFSLGVMLHRMITGKLPFSADNTPALVQRILNDQPMRLKQWDGRIPDDVSRLVAALMEKAPARRPDSAVAISREIGRILTNNGDASVVADAFDAFVRDHFANADLTARTPHERVDAAAGRASFRVRPGKKHLAPISFAAQAALLLLVLTGLLGALYWHAMAAPPSVRAATAIQQAAPDSSADGIRRFDMPGPHWLVNDVQWVGQRDTVLVAVSGRPGTIHHGSRGVLSIDLETGIMGSVSAPVGPMVDSGFPVRKIVSVTPGFVPASARATPLGGAFLVSLPEPMLTRGTRAPGQVLGFAHRWDRSEPEATPLFAIDVRQIPHPGDTPPWMTASHDVSAAFHPNGHTVCLLVDGGGEQRYHLVERDVRWKNPSRMGRRLCASSDPIEGQSMRYSERGGLLVYRRVYGPEESSVWVVDTRGEAPENLPVVTGDIGMFSLSPDGMMVVVSRKRAGGDSRVQVLSVPDGRLQVDAGSGACSASPWHPTNDAWVFLTRDDASGLDQIWKVSTRPPFEKRPLVTFNHSVVSPPVLSRTGRWMAVTVVSDRGHALWFVPWPEDGGQYARVVI